MAKKSAPNVSKLATVPNRATNTKRRPSPDGLAYTAFPTGVGMDWRSGEVHTGKVKKA